LPSQASILTVHDHDRTTAGLTYVYPVVSRRAGGVSVGINLNTNNACNWRCIYCQVPDLTRGGPPAIDLSRLEQELRTFLRELLFGDFMQERVPEEARRINDIALSGNGEPTSAKEFDQVIALIGKVMGEFDLIGKIKLVLITNGSLVHRAYVQSGLKHMAELNGEVWFKLDGATPGDVRRINGTRLSIAKVRENFRIAASLCPTWLQTCVFALDGESPSREWREAYVALLSSLLGEGAGIQGVLLYGLARPSMQPEATRLSALPNEWMEQLAKEVSDLGLTVKLSL